MSVQDELILGGLILGGVYVVTAGKDIHVGWTGITITTPPTSTDGVNNQMPTGSPSIYPQEGENWILKFASNVVDSFKAPFAGLGLW